MTEIERVLKQLKITLAGSQGHTWKTVTVNQGSRRPPKLKAGCTCTWQCDAYARHGEDSRRQWEVHVGARA